MSSAVADRPTEPSEQHAAAGNGDSPGSAPSAGPATSGEQRCANCGAPLAAGQDWCLQCGSGAPGSLSSRTPSWRSAAVILTALAVLVAGAATAAYAALNKSSGPPATTTIAQATPPASTPTTPVTPAPSATATAKIGTPTTITPLPKPAKIPLTPSVTPTPKAIVPTPTPTNTPSLPTGTNKSATTTPKKSSEEVVGEAHPEALTLDTNAASTYNPYNYAATNFGDPSLTIDSDPTTAWTAQLEPSVAPKMAEGVVIDLNTARRLSGAALTSDTPGMTVQVYGSNAATLPSSITDPSWSALTPSFVAKKRHVRIHFGRGSSMIAAAGRQPHRFVVLWISQAPAAAVGTPEAPGHVEVNEFELFPFKK